MILLLQPASGQLGEQFIIINDHDAGHSVGSKVAAYLMTGIALLFVFKRRNVCKNTETLESYASKNAPFCAAMWTMASKAPSWHAEQVGRLLAFKRPKPFSRKINLPDTLAFGEHERTAGSGRKIKVLNARMWVLPAMGPSTH